MTSSVSLGMTKRVSVKKPSQARIKKLLEKKNKKKNIGTK